MAGSTYCVTIPGIKYPAIEEDLNVEARAQVFSACLMVKRYAEPDWRANASHKLGDRPSNDVERTSAQLNSTSFEIETKGRASGGTATLGGPLPPAWLGTKDCDVCPRMVTVPPGSFKMGSALASTEQPIHTVKVRGFLLGKYEVTQAEWTAIMGSNPSANKTCGRNCPVDRVSWSSAQEFIKRLNSRTGLNYRLPSEAEWEYAARAGRNSLPMEQEVETLRNFAWYNSNSGGEVHPVGQKIPNAFGLHDMQGNVWEWVEDVMHQNYQGASPIGQARQVGSTPEQRVLRGGSYFDNPKFLRASHRNADTPDAAYVFFGLRLARDLEPSTLKAEQSGPENAKPQ
ncbi:formylglycine-generating enzyme family protein [Paucibacter sp. Y2R2-4]|uniref:formylglycine-generating enzyme family protein n=1 Tax=Paucibacter sp. Y2R2-4 TaxID=2893553 RepID=UPI0021E3EE59|nr:formylglycine-generating enzyme family protein [Paucibacter sp. Y2R2-4]MCV2351039.1 formylglycine-generating enzyme family protein [Paucibacter sp. Y2R2-4]